VAHVERGGIHVGFITRIGNFLVTAGHVVSPDLTTVDGVLSGVINVCNNDNHVSIDVTKFRVLQFTEPGDFFAIDLTTPIGNRIMCELGLKAISRVDPVTQNNTVTMLYTRSNSLYKANGSCTEIPKATKSQLPPFAIAHSASTGPGSSGYIAKAGHSGGELLMHLGSINEVDLNYGVDLYPYMVHPFFQVPNSGLKISLKIKTQTTATGTLKVQEGYWHNGVYFDKELSTVEYRRELARLEREEGPDTIFEEEYYSTVHDGDDFTVYGQSHVGGRHSGYHKQEDDQDQWEESSDEEEYAYDRAHPVRTYDKWDRPGYDEWAEDGSHPWRHRGEREAFKPMTPDLEQALRSADSHTFRSPRSHSTSAPTQSVPSTITESVPNQSCPAPSTSAPAAAQAAGEPANVLIALLSETKNFVPKPGPPAVPKRPTQQSPPNSATPRPVSTSPSPDPALISGLLARLTVLESSLASTLTLQTEPKAGPSQAKTKSGPTPPNPNSKRQKALAAKRAAAEKAPAKEPTSTPEESGRS
jgi:hypothetical protein